MEQTNYVRSHRSQSHLNDKSEIRGYIATSVIMYIFSIKLSIYKD
jgi:hypothetical protein